MTNIKAGFAGWIEAYDYAWGVSQPAPSTASSAGATTTGRADFKPFSFAKHLDKASPMLALACANGTHIDEIVVEVCRAGGDRVKFMTYRLRNCIISKISTIGGGIFPMESVDIDYGSIEFAYVQQSRKGGTASGRVAGGWNLEKNCKL